MVITQHTYILHPHVTNRRRRRGRRRRAQIYHHNHARAIPHNGSMTTGTESPIVGITPDQDALRPAPRMVEMRSVGFRTCQVSEAGFASEHISAWH